MALWSLVQKRRGKETVVMTGERSKVQDRMDQLRASQRRGLGRRNDPVTYRIEPAAPDAEKFKQKPHNPHPSGNPSGHPRVPRKK